MTPSVSVLIPVFNSENTLKNAMWSILNQSFADIELILYFDGCTDDSEKQAASIKDPRIRIISSKVNQGIVASRNALVTASRAPFIAWLDADDISLPGRLAFQYDYLEVHPEIDVLGSWVEVRNHPGLNTVKWPTEPALLHSWTFFRNPMVQSSLMIRKSALQGYSQDFEYLEDFEFLIRVANSKNIAIYPAVLCSYYESHEKVKIAKYRNYDFVGKLERIMQLGFHNLGVKTGKNELSLIREFLRGNERLKTEDANLIFDFLKNIILKNKEFKVYDDFAFKIVTFWQFVRLSRLNRAIRPRILSLLVTHPALSFNAWFSRPKYS